MVFGSHAAMQLWCQATPAILLQCTREEGIIIALCRLEVVCLLSFLDPGLVAIGIV